jgi:NlpC/P60 family
VRRSTLALGVGLLTLASLGVLPAEAATDPHVVSAERLVDQLDLANTNYEHGQGSVTWNGTVASHTDCSGFIDHLLMHDDGFAADDFKRWFGSKRPTAERYHDAIVEGHGFTRLDSVGELRAGDLIAIKYLTRHDNTGHIMLVIDAPQHMNPAPPYIDGTTQWSVPVIDSSESGHGTTDTRHRRGEGGHDHDGLGRGVFRLYTDAHGRVSGFAWSRMKASRFIAPDDEHLVLGRFVPGFRP